MADTVIVYNQVKQQLLNLPLDHQSLAHVDLTKIGLSSSADLSHVIKSDTFAVVFDGSSWTSQTYMQWEDLRINEALQAIKGKYSESTEKILAHFVAGMDVKYQGKKSWVALLEELGKEIEAR
ncbi:hypothetical protein FD51_GL001482 [Lacticaseibacillus zeae DSM 20178 = KCTC 3804]|uniref:Uncharacterized protein n=2 Tax=Lacticaseibacillus zeae TaxID=57037 RepID=A0A5R8LVK0_LACZE|nr:hypothetical protein [Lacticaseibacillus zeae]KRK13279.1 hypothetical protein FD51_GL001482 [Lacticaseibacillus zeae DSM 20178 = KCTC 3804]OLS06781.1 hypothetical protein AUQ39_09820 [Lacticaseibacillus casei]QVI32111.1 hypothetical protein KG087_00225 [Lacticaseibacillus zeae]TLF41331.1 hypothetical protein FEI14_07905 [Lacticaseibacillus zeae]